MSDVCGRDLRGRDLRGDQLSPRTSFDTTFAV
jgi:hypothetical protein